MPKYRRKQQPSVLGMLYIADVRLVRNSTGEKIKHKILLVGCEQDDIERKLKWVFDPKEFDQLSLSGVEKVREKVHVISTVITQEDEPTSPVIKRREGTMNVPQVSEETEKYDPNLYAVGVSTSVLAKDEKHALRKVGRAIIASNSEGKSHDAPSLSKDSTITVEQIPKSSGYAMPRDVSIESNKAHFVRG